MSEVSPKHRTLLTVEIEPALRVELAVFAARTGRKKKDLVAEALRRLLESAPEMRP